MSRLYEAEPEQWKENLNRAVALGLADCDSQGEALELAKYNGN